MIPPDLLWLATQICHSLRRKPGDWQATMAMTMTFTVMIIHGLSTGWEGEVNPSASHQPRPRHWVCLTPREMRG